MTSSLLNQAVDIWSTQAVVASRHLLRLYRTLGDGKQAATASQAGAPAEERAQRLGLAPRIRILQESFANGNTNETQAESQAWQALVEALAGICAFHSMVDGNSKNVPGLQGSRNSTAKAFHHAIKGFRVAFPEPIAHDGISRALRAAADKCTQTCLEDLGGEESPEDRSAAALEIHKNILEALLDAAELKIIERQN